MSDRNSEPEFEEFDEELDELYYEIEAQGGPVRPDDPAWAPLRDRLGDAEVDRYLQAMVILNPQPGGGIYDPDGKPTHLELKSFGEHYAVSDDHYVAQGGLNSVHKVVDTKFGRTLAVKVPLVRYLNDEEVCRHLRREADLCARLQHPSIVPIYESGRYTEEGLDVAPFFSMKFVEGKTLQSLLKARDETSKDIPYFLGILAQVCGAIAYVHGEGVIHLDLKPGNIMVGDHEEVHVMDWGFARERSESEVAIPARIRALHRISLMTRSDSLFGTAAYMAPEQAGRPSKPTEKSDVFALGGILTHVLTGRPVYVGLDQRETWKLASECRTEEALDRIAASQADTILKALAVSCLQEDPDLRPTAKEVQKEIRAYIERIQEKQIRAERRAKWLTIGLASLVVISLVGSARIWYVLDREARQTEFATRQAEETRQRALQTKDINESIQEVYTSIDQQKLDQASAALQRAKGRLSPNPPGTLAETYAGADRDLTAALNLDEIRQERAVLESDPELPATTALTKYASQFAELGCDPSRSDAVERIAKSRIRRLLVLALDDWANYERNAELRPKLLGLARAVDPDPVWGDRFRDPVVRNNPAKLAELASSISSSKLSIAQIEALVNALPSESPLALKLIREAEVRNPNDFWLNMTAADRLGSVRTPDMETNRFLHREAVGYARAAAAIRPESLGALGVLQRLYDDESRSDEMEVVAERVDRIGRNSSLRVALLALVARNRQDYRESIVLWKKVLVAAPNAAEARLRLADAYSMVGDWRESLRLSDEFLIAHPGNTRAMLMKAQCLLMEKRYAEARALGAEVIRRDPSDQTNRLFFAVLLAKEGRMLDAEVYFRGIRPEQMRDPGAPAMLGLLDLVRGDVLSALADLNESERRMKGPHTQLLRVMILSHLGRFTEAYESLRDFRQMMAKNRTGLGSYMSSNSIIGSIADANILIRETTLKQMSGFEEKFGPDAPGFVKSREEMSPINRLNTRVVGELFFAKKYFDTSTRLYEIGLPPGSMFGSVQHSTLIGSGRISAARAAAQALIGGSNDSVRTTDADRARFRKLAMGWLEEELNRCRTIVARGAGVGADLQTLIAGGNRESANLNLCIMLMNRDLAPVRDPGMIEQMPADDRVRAEALWHEIRALHREVNPPIDLPGQIP